MKSRGTEVLRLLGLARRAGAVVPGTEAARRAVRQGKARLILMAGDASSVQLKKLRKTLGDRPIPQAILGDRAALGAAIGRAPVSAVAVTADEFALRLVQGLGSAVDVETDGVEDEGRACGS